MKLLRSAILGLLVLRALSAAQDYVVTAFDKMVVNMGNQAPESFVTFPDYGVSYSKVDLVFILEKPPGDGDEWDRLGSIFIFDDEGQRIEIGRIITPYWNCPWTWRLDVTDYQLLFHGGKKMKIWIETWKDNGHQATVKLELTKGKPASLPVKITNLWNGSAVGYGNVGNYNLEKFFIPITMPVRANTDKVLLKFAVTGHRFTDNTGQAAEFYRTSRTVKVNDGGNWRNELWKECGSWPVQPQDPGTWYHDRAGWCPGDLVEPWTIDATGEIAAGQAAKIEYTADEYINTGTAKDATHHVESQLFEMRTTNQFILVPVSDFNIIGYETDTLNGTAKTYFVKNFSAASINWNVQKSANWLDVTPFSGSLAADSSASVYVSLNANADLLAKGKYSDTLTFTDTKNRKAERIIVTLVKGRRELIGYWKFDKGSGDVAYDSSGNGNDGTITGATWVDGKQGKALDYNGSAYVTIPQKAFESLLDEVTICLWQYGDAAVQPKNNSIFEGARNGVRIVNSHLPWGDGIVFWDAGASSGFDRVQKQANEGEYEGKWNHWAFTKNSKTGSMKVYLNGILWHSDTAKTRSIGRIESFKIGSMWSGANGYDGMIDEFLVYNCELSAAEIKNIYDGGVTGINTIVSNKTPEAELFLAAPNPADCICPAIRFTYQGEALADSKLVIYDAVGNEVYGESSFSSWNLRNKNGRKVTGGAYLAILKGVNKSGEIRVFKMMIGIINCP